MYTAKERKRRKKAIMFPFLRLKTASNPCGSKAQATFKLAYYLNILYNSYHKYFSS